MKGRLLSCDSAFPCKVQRTLTLRVGCYAIHLLLTLPLSNRPQPTAYIPRPQTGVWKGTVLTAWRLLRCNPLGACRKQLLSRVLPPPARSEGYQSIN